MSSSVTTAPSSLCLKMLHFSFHRLSTPAHQLRTDFFVFFASKDKWHVVDCCSVQLSLICSHWASTTDPITDTSRKRWKFSVFFRCVCVCRGVIFKGTTIGMAPLEGMCSLENSGGITVVWRTHFNLICFTSHYPLCPFVSLIPVWLYKVFWSFLICVSLYVSSSVHISIHGPWI